MKWYRPTWLKNKVIVGGAVLLLLALLAIGLLVARQPSMPKTAHKSSSDTISQSVDKPDEKPVTKDTYQSTAGPQEPKYITMPTIKAAGFVQKMGIDQHGAVASPTNINLVGWYVNSLAPGQPGLSIMDGHVDGWKAPGVFYQLHNLAIGDPFTVELGNGTIKKFKVKAVTSVDDDKAVDALFARDNTITSQLNIITCGGAFDRKAGVYTQRVIVTAEYVAS